ncbi:hypothetical protein LZP69_07590 [Shewanella sp. AS1]|uniref:hypothetical protein n=1 Tax=Shewanella sp. AS1 TaxID=2907626 RepID=UPI001F231DD1|nr:hypothetical protein [Shewanella sp. AS1]MCE9679040.1 hypothetical protein [Shewanella sp. AS1]
MRMIGMLLALLIIGYMIYQQLGGGSQMNTQTELSKDQNGAPQVPSDPKKLKQFEQDMDEFIKQQEEKRKQALEEAQKQ